MPPAASIARPCRLSSRPRPARVAPKAGEAMSDSWLWMTAAELGRGIEARRHRRARADRGLPRRHRQPPRGARHLRPHHARARPRRGRRRRRPRRRRPAPRPARRRAGQLEGPLRHRRRRHRGRLRPARGRVPDRDAAVLATATRAGLVCLGKTHLTELAFSGLGINPVTATPPNINDPELAPGGSSSGAAASVAFGLAAPAIGSDTAGSVRVPAAWNDLVGLKTDARPPAARRRRAAPPALRHRRPALPLGRGRGARSSPRWPADPPPTSPAPTSRARASSSSTTPSCSRPAPRRARPSRPRSGGWRTPAPARSRDPRPGRRRDAGALGAIIGAEAYGVWRDDDRGTTRS